MRKKNDVVKKKIMAFLRAFPSGDSPNYSQISRAVGKSPPTVSKYIEEMSKDGLVKIVDKKSMKLVNLVR